MKKIILVLTLLISANASASGEFMKGAEIYTWKSHGTFLYALVPGTNSLKTKEVIQDSQWRVNSIAELEKRLDDIPPDTGVSWNTGAVDPIDVAAFTLPNKKIVRKIILYCKKRNLNIRVAN